MTLTNQYKGFKRRIALMMAFVLFLSNVGISRYERFCGCSGEVYSSLLIKSESKCCKKHSQAKPQTSNTKKSCCKIGLQQQKVEKETNNCSAHSGKKCCDTEVHYSRLDSDATTQSAALDFPVFEIIAPSNISIPPYNHATAPLSSSDFLALKPLAISIAAPPPLPSGRLLLQQIQIFRC